MPMSLRQRKAAFGTRGSDYRAGVCYSNMSDSERIVSSCSVPEAGTRHLLSLLRASPSRSTAEIPPRNCKSRLA